jgi:hypothetical protein
MNIILPSMGRCGSESLFHAIQEALPDYDHNFYRSLCKVNFKSHTIIKTHDIAPECLPCDCKVIYTFGDVHIISSSVMAQDKEWKKLHFYHFHKEFVNNEISLIKQDGLGLRDNLKSWYSRYKGKILFLHYDYLFESQKLISKYLGVEVKLPERSKRETRRITVELW